MISSIARANGVKTPRCALALATRGVLARRKTREDSPEVAGVELEERREDRDVWEREDCCVGSVEAKVTEDDGAEGW